MFLKVNTRFWDISLVVEAMHMRRTEQMEKVVADDEGEMDLND